MAWYHRLLRTFGSSRLSRDLDREIAFHLTEKTEELVAGGMTEAEARRAARRQFGNPTVIRDRTRDGDLVEWLHSAGADVRYAWRGLLRSPVFTVVAVASLALGIGFNTTIFTLIDTLVLRPLPVPEPERLVRLRTSESGSSGYFTNPLWEQVRDRQQVFLATAAFGTTSFNLEDAGIARRADGAYVSGEYFTTFAVPPAVGRLITPADDRRGCRGIAVLSYRFWRREYAGARDAVGRTIRLTGHPFEIIGVAGERFRGADVGHESDIYVPVCANQIIGGDRHLLDRRSSWVLRVIARLRPGGTVAEADRDLASIARTAYAETVPTYWGVADQQRYLEGTLDVDPLAQGYSDLRDQYGTALLALLAAVGLVLMIACANVANLLLARAEARQRELAIRLAVGAPRARLARQLLTESLLLAAAGAGAGLLVARWAVPAMVTMLAPTGEASLDLALNGRILAFTAGLAGLTVLIFGLMPAWRATRVDAQLAMKAPARTVGRRPARFPVGKLLVAGQVAISLVLVVTAGLFIGTFRTLTAVDAGFNPEGVLVADVDLRRADLSAEAAGPVEQAILARVRELPGVADAASVSIAPVSGSSWNDELIVEGSTVQPADRIAWFNEVSDGYFTTMETRLLAGRDFERTDRLGAERVAIVNDAWARKFLGTGDPLGRRFRTVVADSTGDPITIVGVVENAKYRSLRDGAEPTVYLARDQSTDRMTPTLLVRTTGDPASLSAAVAAAATAIRGGVTLDITTLPRRLDASLQRERMMAVLSGLFGGLALGLAMLGLYGVMTYAVTRRRAELGVRIALGADRTALVRMVLGETMVVGGIGLVVGIVAAVALTRLIASFLYSIRPTDPAIYLTAAAISAAVAAAAGAIPAWRAARVDPLETLREE